MTKILKFRRDVPSRHDRRRHLNTSAATKRDLEFIEGRSIRLSPEMKQFLIHDALFREQIAHMERQFFRDTLDKMEKEICRDEDPDDE